MNERRRTVGKSIRQTDTDHGQGESTAVTTGHTARHTAGHTAKHTVLGRSGSALIWALVVMLVLMLLLASTMAIIQSRQTRSATTHVENQAYYTALSTTNTIAGFLKSASGTTATAAAVAADAEALLAKIQNAPGVTFDIAQTQLPEGAGSCRVNLKYTDWTGKREKLKITATATFQDKTETVAVTLLKVESGTYHYPTSGFDPVAKYGQKVGQINSGTNGFQTDPAPVNIAPKKNAAVLTSGPTITGSDGTTSASSKRDYSTENRATLNSAITGTGSTREATWMERSYIDGWNRNEASGPHDVPYIQESLRVATTDKGPIAKTRLLVPKNGKIMINPISYASSAAPAPNFSHALDTDVNVKTNMFSITDTAGKDVKLRLGNSGEGKRTGNVPKFAYVSLDFYDNNTPVQISQIPGVTTEHVRINNPDNVSSGVEIAQMVGQTFYPNTWNSCTVYTKNSSNEVIDSELFFGIYGAIHSSWVIDYRCFANYVSHHWGYVNQLYSKMIVPQNITETFTVRDAKNKAGYGFPPVYWGNDFSMFLLDGPHTSEAARITQGVYIVNKPKADGSATGVLYSNRNTKIGGAMTILTKCRTYEGIRTIMDGFDGNSNWVTAQSAHPSYHQVIENTDLVFVTDGTAPRSSEILHPDGTKPYGDRSLMIKGGSIYVGDKHNLTIDSEIKDGLNVQGEIAADGISLVGTKRSGAYSTYYDYTSQGSYMYIRPNEIVVDAGGTLTILGNQNDHDNVETDIYVRGGTLNIEAGAKIKGNIYVYNGGILNVRGSFRLDSAHGAAETDAEGNLLREFDGIHIYGDAAVRHAQDHPQEFAGAAGITAPGRLNIMTVALGLQITGTSNRIHLLGKASDLIGTLTGATQANPMPGANNWLCDKRGPLNHECRHMFGGGKGGWVTAEEGYTNE